MQLSGRMCGQGSRCPGYRQTKSAPDYNRYVEDVLMPAMDQAVLIGIKQFEADGRTDDPRYEQLLMHHHYALHVCRSTSGPTPYGAGSHTSTP